MRYLHLYFFIALLLTGQPVSGQYYDTGQDPASLKWMQIKTNHFTVIYPEKYDSGGKAFARSLDNAYSGLITLFPEKKIKIPVIIHSFSTQSNGYVAWAPRRMEIYPTPEQNTIPLDPDKQLAIHELAHVFQMESLDQGFSKVMTLLTGQQFIGAVSSLLPFWFLEGDAVFAETVLTGSGRGRSPSFQKALRALAVESPRFYKYDKSLNDSYRDFVPDYYESGYQMVTWAIAKYDPQIWNNVLKFTGEQPFTINPVNLSLRKSAMLTKKRLYQETFDTLRTIWTNDIVKDKAHNYESVNPEKHGKFINYYSPVIAGSDSIIAIRTSLSDPAAFVLLNPSTKNERKLHIPGQMYPMVLSYARGKLVWVESEPDKRWENRDYSVIKIMDINNKQTRRLSRKTRYMSASVSPDGKIISAVENTVNNSNNLIFIDTESGKILQSVAAPGNAFLQRPQWAEGGKALTVIFLAEAGEGIMSYSLATHSWEILVEAGKDDLQSSFMRNDSLFFISSRSGTDNIFLRTMDKKINRLTRSKFGTADICLKGNTIIFSDYTTMGNTVCRTGIGSDLDSGTVNVSSSSYLVNRIKTKYPETGNNNLNEYTPEPYRKWQHLLRFHSWMPFYADIEQIKSDPTAVRPGFSLMTQNNLSTLTSSIGYEYSKEKNNVLHSRITWKGWYPVIESQLSYGYSPVVLKTGESVSNPSVIQPGLQFSNAISLPLQFSSGRFSEYLRPSFTSDYENRYIYIKENGTYDYGQTLLSARLYFTNYDRSALRDIYPRWAQTFDLEYTFAPFDKVIYGTDLSLRTSFFFPGFFPNNSIKIRVEIEKQDPGKYLFGNRISFPRGYKTATLSLFGAGFNSIISKKISFYSVDYFLPLAYPDFNLSSLLYLKRIRTDLFFDYASGTGNYYYYSGSSGSNTSEFHNYNENFRSFGFELMADFHLLRIPFMISGGVQASWKKISEKPSLGLLFNIDLFGMNIGKRRS
jgi:hypothetical protein